MNPRDIAVPGRMQHLPRDRRGYPIPFGAFVDVDGTPHFTINDEQKRAQMIAHDLCSICGKVLLRGRWFAGGPRSAFDPRGVYIDMPMHDECVHYALRVCPYLAAPMYVREVGTKKAATVKSAVVLVDSTMLPDRPPLFVALMAVGQHMEGSILQSYVKPHRPYRRVEYWRHGERLPDNIGASICDEVMKQTAQETKTAAS